MIGSIIGGIIGKGGADQAAGAIGGASDQALAASIHQQEVNRSDASPWTALGRGAVNKIGQLYGLGKLYGEGGNGGLYDFTLDPTGEIKKQALNDFQTSPGYTFRRDEGIKALDRSAAAKGRLLSGAQIKGVQNFGDNLAADEYGSYVNQLNTMAGMGQSADQNVAGLNTSLTQSANSNLMQGAIARGSAYMHGADALGQGIVNGVNNVIGGGYLFRNQLFGGGGGMGAGLSGMGR